MAGKQLYLNSQGNSVKKQALISGVILDTFFTSILNRLISFLSSLKETWVKGANAFSA